MLSKLLAFALMAPLLAGCQDASPVDQVGPFLFHVGDKIIYHLQVGDVTAEALRLDSIDDGMNEKRNTVVYEISGPFGKEMLWVDAQTGIVVRNDFDDLDRSNIQLFQASQEWFIRQDVFGSHPFLAGWLFGRASRESGWQELDLGYAKAETRWSQQHGNWRLDIRFEQVAKPEREPDVRESFLEFHAGNPYPIGFGDLFGLGSWTDAKLTGYLPGHEVMAGPSGTEKSGLHPKSSHLSLSESPEFGASGIQLSFASARQMAESNPTIASFRTSNPEAFIAEAHYSPMPPTWEIGFCVVNGESSYATTVQCMDAQVRGAMVNGNSVALPATVDDYLVDPVAHYPSHFFAMNGLASLGHATEKAASELGDSMEITYEATLDPLQWGGKEEAVATYYVPAGSQIRYSGINGQRLGQSQPA